MYVIGIAIFSATLQYNMTDYEFQYIAIQISALQVLLHLLKLQT